MSDDLKRRIRQKLAGPQMYAVATVTPTGAPWVRYMMGVVGEDLTVRLTTFRGSRKVRQLEENPAVHLTAGVTDVASAESYVQIAGTARVTDDETERRAMWNDKLEAYFDGPDDERYVVMIVRPERIELQSMKSMQPEVWRAG